MAKLSPATISTILTLQQRLLGILDEAVATAYLILDRYGETEAAIAEFDRLQNVRERVETYYSRFHTLLLRIAESYPVAPSAVLELLNRSLEEASATANASEATIREAKQDWNLL